MFKYYYPINRYPRLNLQLKRDIFQIFYKDLKKCFNDFDSNGTCLLHIKMRISLSSNWLNTYIKRNKDVFGKKNFVAKKTEMIQGKNSKINQ